MQERPSDLPVEEWDISRLRPNPLQMHYFRWRPPAEMDAFIESMKSGQRDPIDVLPNGVILAGHHRWKAARRLGWRSVKVVVRRDLEALGDDACERYFLASNRAHRKLKPLEKARLFARLRVLGDSDHSKQLAEELDLSDRQLRRLCQLLQAPTEVQNAIDDGKLTQKAGRRVAEADSRQKQQIAKLIRDGRAPEIAVRKVLGFQDRERLTPVKIQRRWREFLAKGRDLRDLGPDALSGLMPAHGRKLGQVMEWMVRLALLAALQQLATLKGPITITIVADDAS